MARGVCLREGCCDTDKDGWCPVCPPERISNMLDDLVGQLGCVLSERSTEELRAIMDEAERRNPTGWLTALIASYLDVWR